MHSYKSATSSATAKANIRILFEVTLAIDIKEESSLKIFLKLSHPKF